MKKMLLLNDYREIYEMGGEIDEQTNIKEVKLFASLIKGKQKVLDIGCAEGKLAIELAKRGHNVYAMDISSIFISKVMKGAKDNVE